MTLSLLCVSALTSVSALAGAIAAETKPVPLMHTEAATQAIEEIQYKKGFLSHLYKAQISLHNEQKIEAAKHINAALTQLDSITPAQPQEHADYGSRKVIELGFGAALMPERAVIPMPDDALSQAVINDKLEIEGLKPENIQSAEVRYIRFELDQAEARKQLKEAQAALKEDDYYSAQYDILQITRSMLEEDSDIITARMRARDQIALTRYMVNQGAYDAARNSLELAEDALSDLADTSADSDVVHRIYEAVETLDEAIAKNDPSLIANINEQLEQWWMELS